MLKRIKIQGYKSLVDVDVELQPLSVLFGPNAVGKSNFLDALQLLSRVATSRTLKEAFDPPYRGTPLESFHFGPGGVKSLLKRESARFAMEADVELSPEVVLAVERQIAEMRGGRPHPDDVVPESNGREQASHVRERALRYRVEIELLPRSGILRVTDEYLAALTTAGQPTGKRKPFLEKVGEGTRQRLHLRREGQAHPIYHEMLLDHTILSQPLYPPHYPHLTAVRQELARWYFFYFEPRERMRLANPVKEVRHIGLMGEELAAYLNTLFNTNEPQFRAVEKALGMLIPRISGIEVEPNDLGEVELRIKEGDIPIPARVVSEGTLRILGLLSLHGSRDAAGLVGFEEPENGIQPRRLQSIADYLESQAELGTTQMIVTTHSPLLPDQVAPQYLFVCGRSGAGGTTIRPFSTWGVLSKRADIESALEEERDADVTPVSTRILRGDFES